MGEVGRGRPRFERGVRGRQGRTPLPGCCQVRVNQEFSSARGTYDRSDRSTERDIPSNNCFHVSPVHLLFIRNQSTVELIFGSKNNWCQTAGTHKIKCEQPCWLSPRKQRRRKQNHSRVSGAIAQNRFSRQNMDFRKSSVGVKTGKNSQVEALDVCYVCLLRTSYKRK